MEDFVLLAAIVFAGMCVLAAGVAVFVFLLVRGLKGGGLDAFRSRPSRSTTEAIDRWREMERWSV